MTDEVRRAGGAPLLPGSRSPLGRAAWFEVWARVVELRLRHGGGRVRVRTTACLELPGDEVVLVPADLVYRSRDCLAVTMVLCGPDGEEAGWTFAWDLLRQGLTGPAGRGDIRIRPAPGAVPMVEVALSGRYEATVLFPTADVRSFVSRVRTVAPLDAPRIQRSLGEELATIMGKDTAWS